MFTAILGITGIGKTTLSNNLAQAVGGVAFNEPDRSEWPDFISTGFLTRPFEVMQWFRSYQIEAIFRAKEESLNQPTFTDAYYQKILVDYIREDSSGWIISKDSEYFENYYETCVLDKMFVPDPDRIIFIHAEKSEWVKLISNRSGPSDAVVIEHGFQTQKHMRMACERLAEESSIPIYCIEQQFGNPNEIARLCQRWLANSEI